MQEFALALTEIGFEVNRHYIGKLFDSWRVSRKRIRHKHINKFSAFNIANTAHFLYWIRDPGLNWLRLKFCDEVHFDARGSCSAVC
jgi:hypothetical protein